MALTSKPTWSVVNLGMDKIKLLPFWALLNIAHGIFKSTIVFFVLFVHGSISYLALTRYLYLPAKEVVFSESVSDFAKLYTKLNVLLEYLSAAPPDHVTLSFFFKL